VLLFYQNLLGTVLLAVPAFLTFESMTLSQAGLLLTYGLVIGVLSFSLYFKALRHIKLSSAAPLIYVEVVSALVFGIVLFQEEFSLFNGLGATLILFGVALVGLAQATQKSREPAHIVAFPDKTADIDLKRAKGQTLQKHAQS
jgi:drug/metabolite transporter (DMT)-like permease